MIPRPYLVTSDLTREEHFAHFFPALLTYLGRRRELFGATLVNLDRYDGSWDGYTDGLTDDEWARVEAAC